MGLKERGITVGDLLIILIIIISTTILVKAFNKEKKTTLNLSSQQEISYRDISIIDIYPTNSIYF